MLTISFWNLRGRRLERLVAQLAADSGADLLVLAECATPMADLLPALNVDRPHAPFVPAPGHNTKVLVLTALPPDSVRMVADIDGIAFREVTAPGARPLLLAGAHLQSKLFLTAEDQAQQAFNVVGDIERAEEQCGHSRTVVIGDLNMNPFEPGVVGSSALHAVNSRTVAARLSRIVGGHERSFFYNPSWRFFSDSGSVPGTYYYAHSGAVSYFWNVFDQVLLRPSVLPLFPPAGLQLVTVIGTMPLVTPSGLPDKRLASDHLPITLRLDPLATEET